MLSNLSEVRPFGDGSPQQDRSAVEYVCVRVGVGSVAASDKGEVGVFVLGVVACGIFNGGGKL